MPAASEEPIAFETLALCPCCTISCDLVNRSEFRGMTHDGCVLYGYGIAIGGDTVFGYYMPVRDVSIAMAALTGQDFFMAYLGTSGIASRFIYATEQDAIDDVDPIGTTSLGFDLVCDTGDEGIIRFDAYLLDPYAVQPDINLPRRLGVVRSIPGTVSMVDPTGECPPFTIQLGPLLPPP
jgi:hypothetical protein